MLAIITFIFTFITISNGQLSVCGTATVGPGGLFGCTFVDYQLPQQGFERCISAEELKEIDPEAECSVELTCNCQNPNTPQIIVDIFTDDQCNNRHSTNPLGRDQACAGFDTCRGQYEARITGSQFDGCCSCNDDKHDFIDHIFN